MLTKWVGIVDSRESHCTAQNVDGKKTWNNRVIASSSKNSKILIE